MLLYTIIIASVLAQLGTIYFAWKIVRCFNNFLLGTFYMLLAFGLTVPRRCITLIRWLTEGDPSLTPDLLNETIGLLIWTLFCFGLYRLIPFVQAGLKAQRDLRESEGRQRALLRGIPDLLCVIDNDGTILEYKSSHDFSGGRTVESVQGKPLSAIFSSEFSVQAMKGIQEALRNSAPYTMEYQHAGLDGKRYEREARYVALDHRRVLVIIRDVTLIRQQFRALEKLEERYRLANEAGRVVVWEVDLATQSMQVDGVLMEWLGYSRSMLPQSLKAWQPFYYPEDYREMMRLVVANLRGIITEYSFKSKLRHADGTPRWWHTHGRAFHDERGRAVRILGTTTEITEQTKTEQHDQQTQELLRSIIDAAPCLIDAADTQGRLLTMNQFEANFYNLAGREVAGTTFSELGLSQSELDQERRREVLRTQAPVVYENTFTNHAGVSSDYLSVQAPLTNHQGALQGVVRIGLDISRQKQAQRELKLQEEQYRAIFEAYQDGIAVLDQRGIVVELNDGMCRVLARDKEELLHKHPLAVKELHPRMVEILEALLPEITTAEYIHQENFLYLPDGTSRPVELKTMPLQYRGERHILVLLRDISERKRTEEALRLAEQQRRDLLDTLPMYFSQVDRDQRYVWVNVAYEQLYNRPRKEIIGMRIPDLQTEEQYALFRPMIERVLSGERVQELCSLKKRDGEMGHYEVTYVPHFEHLQAIGYFVHVRDVTAVVTSAEEKESLERQFQEAQKRESLGILAGGIAHDFNNLLTGIMGFAGLIKKQIAKDSTISPSVDRILLASSQAADLTKQMLAYAGKGKFIVKELSLSRMLREMIDLLKSSVSKRITLVNDLDPLLSLIEGDESQIRQIAMNLILNAAEAIGDREGKILLRTGSMLIDSDFAHSLLPQKIALGKYAMLEVTDTGCGMDAETLGKIFDPFFTTKFTGRGLGLAAVHGIVRGHKGAVQVFSELGKGTTFKIYFPAKKDELTFFLQDGPEEAAPVTTSGTVLIVDDEDTIRDVTQQGLQYAGYRTIVASDGQEAVKLYQEHGILIDAVLLDLTMPKMNGKETLEALLQIKPDLRIIMMSGYNEQEVTPDVMGKGLAGFIQKPFRIDDLLDMLGRTLQA